MCPVKILTERILTDCDLRSWKRFRRRKNNVYTVRCPYSFPFDYTRVSLNRFPIKLQALAHVCAKCINGLENEFAGTATAMLGPGNVDVNLKFPLSRKLRTLNTTPLNLFDIH